MTPAFLYRAVDRQGRERQGRIAAPDAASAQARLVARHWQVMRIQPAPAVARAPGRLGLRSRALLTRQLAALVAVSPVEEALRIMLRQAGSTREGAVIRAVHAGVCEGLSLAEALARAPHAFPPVYRAMVGAGESAGRLPQIAARLADLIERQAQVRARLAGALAYPAALAVVAIAVVTGLMVAVVPRVVEQFDAASRQLPWLTRMVIGLSGFLAAWGWAVLATLALAAVGFVRGLAWPPFRAAVDGALLRLPLLGPLWRDAQAAALARTLATMIAARLPLLDGLRLAAQTAQNTLHARALGQVAQGVREGGSLAAGLAQAELGRAGLFPPLLVAMAASGEASGQLGALLESAANALDRSFEAAAATALALLEPAIIVVMGGIVALIILAILLPILQLQTLTGT
ncbi:MULTISPECIES: type II secretion system F family protein [unclassified Novosphingobium]|uniref:type II secretion system F family protein n=1 Tax=unclassified Novosphingobium TaxID=2644732 RepID=UPI00146B6F8C|nr:MULTISPECIES: type II secretion system F family protein [unclassified Novosphingobium]NMN03286.1 general secretion pathway protein F [Novosphingobium sp. SG919]NMN86724.1 general secretion pathway protein F [Novosphingobium sp. SG916]